MRTTWILFATLAAAFLLGQGVTVTLFALISFWALHEFITITPTRPGDHLPLVWVSFLFPPLQFLLVYLGADWYGLYNIFIPVYAFLFVPAADRPGRRPQTVFGTGREDSMGAVDLRLLLQLCARPADAQAAAARGPARRGRRARPACCFSSC